MAEEARQSYTQQCLSELKTQRNIALPLMAMNLTWLLKTTITTAFLGRLGDLQLAGGALALTFANVTGYAVLNGLCGAMEPICGQAFGAKNSKLLRKTLVMSTMLLLLVTVPISLLWLHVDAILARFGQQQEITAVTKSFLLYLLPDLVVTSLLYPLKSYLTSQSLTIPIMITSALSLAFHVPFNVLLARAKGLEGVSMAVWASDLVAVIGLVVYLCYVERNGRAKGGWFEQGFEDWLRLMKLSFPCCLTTCLEWWCYEFLILLTGRLKDAKRALGVIAIVMNFDYLLYSVMISIATCASTRVSNELGASRAFVARRSGFTSLGFAVVSGFVGGLVMIAARGSWGTLFSRDKGIVKGVQRTMLLMALVEVVNFPLAVCGGIVRGTARPWLAMYASLAGFYFLALPLGVVLAFKVGLGLGGLLMGFFVGVSVSLVLLLLFVLRIDWNDEAQKAQALALSDYEENGKDANHKTASAEAAENDQV